MIAIDGTVAEQTVFPIQHYFGRYPPDGAGDGRYRNFTEVYRAPE